MGKRESNAGRILPGTLDLLILRALRQGERHGYAIAEFIHASSESELLVEEGALYPALHRLQRRMKVRHDLLIGGCGSDGRHSLSDEIGRQVLRRVSRPGSEGAGARDGQLCHGRQ